MVRVISSQNQDVDGEAAGERACRWLKDPENPWKVCPFLLVLEDSNVSPIKSNPKAKIWISSEMADLVTFATAPVIPKNFAT